MFIIIVWWSQSASSDLSILSLCPSLSACVFTYYQFQSYHWPPSPLSQFAYASCLPLDIPGRPSHPWHYTYNDYPTFRVLFHGICHAFHLLMWVTSLSSADYWDPVAISLWIGPTRLVGGHSTLRHFLKYRMTLLRRNSSMGSQMSSPLVNSYHLILSFHSLFSFKWSPNRFTVFSSLPHAILIFLVVTFTSACSCWTLSFSS